MAFVPKLRDLLASLPAPLPLRELACGGVSGTGVRHDIDHSLDAAVELAWLESQIGVRASYYILHDAPYMDEADAYEKIRLIQAFGHEVGLHANFLAQWMKGESDTVAGELAAVLARFRREGLDVTSIAAHGDPLCYEKQFTNYWLWSELRPSDPVRAERGVNAEGRTLGTGPDIRSISYPGDAAGLTREDGASFEFWSQSLDSLGLDFEASRLEVDAYFSDSGNRWWTGEPDPAALNPHQRTQILIHPEHWRAPPRHIYLMSTARSGTSWIAHALQKASTATARHEFTLNHDPSRPDDPVKNTAFIADLQDDPDRAAGLIAAARAHTEGLGNDCVEANVYLPHFLDRLPHAEDTEFVHLHRRPQDVVRSLLQRQWYEVPHDRKHPRMDVPGWSQMDQFEQACWYVRGVNEALMAHCDRRLSFDAMISDPDYLVDAFAEFGIGIEAGRLREACQARRNETPRWDIDPVEDWPQSWRDRFAGICGPICEALGYTFDPPSRAGTYPALDTSRPDPVPPRNLADTASLAAPGGVSRLRADRAAADPSLSFVADHAESAVILLGGGYWRNSMTGTLRSGPDAAADPDTARLFAASGWAAEPLTVYALELELDMLATAPPARLFCLSYDEQGALLEQKVIAAIGPDSRQVCCNFRPHRQAVRFNLAIFKSPGPGLVVTIADFRLVAVIEDRRLALTAEAAIAAAGDGDVLPAPVVETRHAFTLPPPEPWNVRHDPDEARGQYSLSDPERAGHVLCFGDRWSRLDRSANPAGPELDRRMGDLVAGEMVLGQAPAMPVNLFALIYDAGGKLDLKVRLGRFDAMQASLAFRFEMPRDGAVAIAVHLPPETPPIILDRLVIDIYTSQPDGGATERHIVAS